MEFSIKDFFSFQRLWSPLLKKSIMGNLNFSAVIDRPPLNGGFCCLTHETINI